MTIPSFCKAVLAYSVFPLLVISIIAITLAWELQSQRDALQQEFAQPAADASTESLSSVEVYFPFDAAWHSELTLAAEKSVSAFVHWYHVLSPAVAWSVHVLRHKVEVVGVVGALLLLWTLQVVRVPQRIASTVRRYYIRISYRVNEIWEVAASQLAAKSRVAAILLPHTLFVCIVVVIFVLVPTSWNEAVCSPHVLAVFAIILPSLLAARALSITFFELPSRPDHPDSRRVSDWLAYFCVLFSGVFLYQLPFASQLFSLISHLSIFPLASILWLYMPVLRGAELLCCVLARFVSMLYAVPEPASRVRRKQVASWLRIFVNLRLLSEATCHRIEQMLDGGAGIILALPFVFTPGFVTCYGVLLVGNGYPLLVSLSALASLRPWQTRRWLCYWLIFAAFFMGRQWVENAIGIWPLWYHILLVLVLWLQLPLTRGAEKIFSFVLSFYRKVNFSDAALQIQRLRLSTSLQTTPQRPTVGMIASAETVVDPNNGSEKEASDTE